MTIEDKLKLVKREREARSRSQKIEKTWEQINANDELSVKEKLQKLITLSGGKKERKAAVVPSETLRREPVLFLENPYVLDAHYGKIPISLGLDVRGDVLAFLSREPAFADLDLSSALFIDLETTGLSGGTGTVAFLVGMGFYRDQKFNVVQFFLGDLAEEERMIEELSLFFRQMNFRSVVTYNGKGFDLPILETRFALKRKPFPLSDLPHLDFLFSARSLWKHKYDNCRLFNLAREVVEADRSEDIPSAEIPARYFEYIRSGDFSLIEPILYHNQEDILSLLGVVVIGALLLSEDGSGIDECRSDGMDLFGVGNLFEKAGHIERSLRYFERALEGNLTGEISLLIKRKLSLHFKKNEDWDKAVALWEELASMEQPFSFRELAMYYEHREKKYEEARKMAEHGLALSLPISPFYRRDFARRLERLNERIRKQKGGAHA